MKGYIKFGLLESSFLSRFFLVCCGDKRQLKCKQIEFVCERFGSEVWLFWLSVLRHKLTANGQQTTVFVCCFLVARVLATFLLRDLRRKLLACRYFNCNSCPVICLALVNVATLIAGQQKSKEILEKKHGPQQW